MRSFLTGTLAHIPSVIVQSDKIHSQFFLTDGIERTTDGFTEGNLSCAESLLKSAETTVVYRTVTHIDRIITGKHTVLPIDDTRHKVALLIDIGDALTVDYRLR